MSPDSDLTCYADDMLVLVWGKAWGGIVRLAKLAVARVVAAIKGLGLRMSPEKSEAMWFCRRADHGTPPAGYRLRLEGAEIGVGTNMKYLGLTLDSHWTFGAHFERLAPSVEATASALGCLLPRLGGPGVGVRRLYAGVVRPRLLYEIPIWAEDLMASRRSLLKVRRLHRTVVIRVVRSFRTISAAAAAVIAGFSPFELQALKCREIYLHTWGLSDGVGPVGADVNGRGRLALLDRWRASLDMRAGVPGLRVLEAALPNWDVWLDGAGPPWLTGWRRCSPGTGALVNICTESEKRRPRVATTAMRACSTRWSTVRRERSRAATSSRKSDGTSRCRLSSRHCWWAREGGGPWPPSVSRLCFGRWQRRGWGCGTPTPRGSAGGGAADAADVLGRGALGPPRSPMGVKLRRE